MEYLSGQTFFVLVATAFIITALYFSVRTPKFVKAALSVHRTKKVPQPTANKRSARVRPATAELKNGVTGFQIMEIPAYARKAKGVFYPMNLKVLNGATSDSSPRLLK